MDWEPDLPRRARPPAAPAPRRRGRSWPLAVALGVVAVLTGATLIYAATRAGSVPPVPAGAASLTGPAPTGSGPVTGSPGSAPPTAATSAAPTAATSAAPAAFTFPVQGTASYSRTHHDYPASDIIAACGTPVVAITDGIVLATSPVDTYDPKVNAGATRGGLSVSILGNDGVRYYGSHLSSIDPKATPGARVSRGQRLGKVGDTGDASACHLHFGISPPCLRVGDWWIQRGVVWPWRYLDSWRTGGARSPVAEVTAWQAAHGCPTKPLVFP